MIYKGTTNMKKCLTSLVREMQIKNKLRYHLRWSRMVTLNKTKIQKISVSEDVEKLETVPF